MAAETAAMIAKVAFDILEGATGLGFERSIYWDLGERGGMIRNDQDLVRGDT